MLPQSNIYLTGDFNIDFHKHTAAAFEDIMFGNGFSPLISIATNFKPGCSPSCIDNILTNSTDLVVSSGVCEPVAEAAIEDVQASVDALKLLVGDWCLKIEIVIVFGNILSRYQAFYSSQTFECKRTHDLC